MGGAQHCQVPFSTTPQDRHSVCVRGDQPVGLGSGFSSRRPLNPLPSSKGPQVGAWVFRWKKELTVGPACPLWTISMEGSACFLAGVPGTTVQLLFLHLLSPVWPSPLLVRTIRSPKSVPPEEALLPVTQMDQGKDYSLLP